MADYLILFAIALAAVRIGQRPPDDQRTVGYRRFENLAAAFNAILLFAAAGYVLISLVRGEAVRSRFTPQPHQRQRQQSENRAGQECGLRTKT